MAKTTRPYVGDGVTVLYPVNFDLGYLRREYIYVYLDGDDYTNQLGYTWIDDTQIQLDAPVAAGVSFIIRRVVPRDELVNDYEDGAILRENNLDDSFRQPLMMMEEIQDGFINPDGESIVNADINMLQNRIYNLPLAQSDSDAVSYGELKSFVLDEQGGLNLLERCEDAAESAETSESNTTTLYNDFRDDYMGNGPSFPTPRKEGSLWYYDGPDFTQGLYIHYAANNDPYTGTWDLVSGVGPQGPTGPQGVEGPEGLQGIQGERGVQGEQGQQGIQGAIGDTGPAGPKGETGATGPQGPQGVVGPQGDEGPQGIQGPQGVQGPQGNDGPTGPQGNDGQSFQIDAIGLLSERSTYDSEAENFTFYATDYSVSANTTPSFDEFTGDGSTTDYPLTFVPDGPQSIQVIVGGVPQSPAMYTVDIQGTDPEMYTIQFNEAIADNTKIVIREFSLATGYGAIYIKESASPADWSEPIPFGKGPRGDEGPIGPQGIVGPQGPQGIQGQTGPTGAQGPAGIQGPQGATGDVGPQGAKGDTGDRGPDGIQGPQGPQGAQGPQGEQGITGQTGPQGPQGEQGLQGARGDQGAVGPTGPKGATGDQGPTGNAGADGADGQDGQDGADGRSSSGKLYDIDKVNFTSGDSGVTKTLFEFNILTAQTFERALKVSNLFGTRPTTGVAVAEIRLRRTGSAGYTDGGLLSLSGGAGLINPLDAFGSAYITIPASWTGTITVEAYCDTTTTGFDVRAGKDTSVNGLAEVTLIPASTELGEKL